MYYSILGHKFNARSLRSIKTQNRKGD